MTKLRIGFFCMLVLGVLSLLASRGALAAGLEADMVMINGKILTADTADLNDFTVAQAAAVYNEKFVVVGSNEEALEFAGPSTRRIDLDGRTVIPGLVETHNHIYSYGSHFFPKGQKQVGEMDPPICKDRPNPLPSVQKVPCCAPLEDMRPQQACRAILLVWVAVFFASDIGAVGVS